MLCLTDDAEAYPPVALKRPGRTFPPSVCFLSTHDHGNATKACTSVHKTLTRGIWGSRKVLFLGVPVSFDKAT